jgi:hypothetical protein
MAVLLVHLVPPPVLSKICMASDGFAERVRATLEAVAGSDDALALCFVAWSGPSVQVCTCLSTHNGSLVRCV